MKDISEFVSETDSVWAYGGDTRTSVSILGDSISTYAGYNNSSARNKTTFSNAVWYPNPAHKVQVDLENVWWYKFLKYGGYSLCVNNSYSGSLVAEENTVNIRAVNLHTESGVCPDIIIVFMGVNDYGSDVPLEKFGAYYQKAVNAMKNKYNAEIYLCTFLPNVKYVPVGANGLGLTQNDYNEVIRHIAENSGVHLIDLAEYTGITPENTEEFSIDRLHPNSAGMSEICRVVKNCIENNK